MLIDKKGSKVEVGDVVLIFNSKGKNGFKAVITQITASQFKYYNFTTEESFVANTGNYNKPGKPYYVKQPGEKWSKPQLKNLTGASKGSVCLARALVRRGHVQLAQQVLAGTKTLNDL